MDDHANPLRMTPADEPASGWADRYGQKHRWVRLTAFPPGITPPRKVRVYRRADTHYVLNWWDPAARKNLSERVDGDLLAALLRARQVDERVTAVRSAGVGAAPRVGHADLVARFLADVDRRAQAGEVAPKTAARYRTALDHYLAYCATSAAATRYPAAVRADRDFRLGLTAFLAERTVGGTGPGGPRPMRGQRYVLDTVRAAFAWAADPAGGGLLPDAFRNPFLRSGGKGGGLVGDPLAAPDVTAPMAADLVRACDAFQLKLFVPMLLCGLRAAEPCHLLRADLTAEWLTVPCRPAWRTGRTFRKRSRWSVAVR
ncbi:hypothetical protein PX52LOC_03819 [Limnoglobus roseus]|uniref:Core-binding (CB) domain-containing protein n=2 Tax=Limnoglobus roseus TaxID=2598579 RepID=A0A5C1AE41_9BACT|nr:hypothetical protein PX52LOC_03819 [Limnoglobus roseus]